jgi:branched-chain amino acid transport system permease protein
MWWCKPELASGLGSGVSEKTDTCVAACEGRRCRSDGARELEVEHIVQVVVSGLFIGFVFSLLSMGLSLIFGVMDLVNFAHGEFLMLGMYIAFWGYKLLDVDPMLSLPFGGAVMAILGAVVYKLLISRILNAPRFAQFFATFGLMVFLRSIAQFLWTPDWRLVTEPLTAGRIGLFGIYVGRPQAVAALGSLVMAGLLNWFLNHTELGTALRATAQDRQAASLLGINTEHMFALAWAVSSFAVGVAGALLVTFYPVHPNVGATFALICFVVVALGGFGNVGGAFIAGLLVGLTEVLSGFLVAPAYKLAAVYSLYLLVVFFRPQGLLGRW